LTLLLESSSGCNFLLSRIRCCSHGPEGLRIRPRSFVVRCEDRRGAFRALYLSAFLTSALEHFSQYDRTHTYRIQSANRSNLRALPLSKHIISRPLRPLHPRRRSRHLPLQLAQPLNTLPPSPLNLLLPLPLPDIQLHIPPIIPSLGIPQSLFIPLNAAFERLSPVRCGLQRDFTLERGNLFQKVFFLPIQLRGARVQFVV
jgi:hypothetical protein